MMCTRITDANTIGFLKAEDAPGTAHNDVRPVGRAAARAQRRGRTLNR